ncbi:colanic acid biosynthesis glycosyltransferase WcaL [Rhodobacteraceae bacterium RKSG542]|uniref:glycosyltransferase family 4 protein n=1 Tax=Pseudovibrio flavus TaxID=2529854 RepID=UPI0012BB7A68|nr:glycosyltransferase family 4 protein [Pseudovibrio flavus]MTI18902.1 colanic acid biosynthesis glycosyltransferase WcaL [Pseudovibrio flavus]
MKTIGYVLAEFPVLSETFVGNEMRAMQAQGHTVIPYVLREVDGPAQAIDVTMAQEEAFYPVKEPDMEALKALTGLSGSCVRGLSFAKVQNGIPMVSLMGNALKIARLAKAHGVDHLHAHFAGAAAAHAIVAARMIGASVSFVCHGHDVYAEAQDLPLKLTSADFVVSVCNDLTKDLQDFAPKASVHMVPCGTAPERFVPRKDAEKNGRLLFVGRLVEQKGTDDIFAALAQLGPLAPAIDIVGSGPLMEELEQESLGNGLYKQGLTFLGPKPAEWISENAPSYVGLIAPFKEAPDGARDTGPLVVKEAMAMELPVITTRFMGMKETVTPETGFMVEPGDPEGLARAIVELMALSDVERQVMGRAGRKQITENFTLEGSAKRLSRIIENQSGSARKVA